MSATLDLQFDHQQSTKEVLRTMVPLTFLTFKYVINGSNEQKTCNK